jgi:hypothetical protein
MFGPHIGSVRLLRSDRTLHGVIKVLSSSLALEPAIKLARLRGRLAGR